MTIMEIRKKHTVYFLGIYISCFLLGCSSANKNKLDFHDSENRMKEILDRGDYVTSIYTSVYNDQYNDYSGIESAVAGADAIIDELNSFVCTGKFEMRRRNAIKIMTRMRNDLKVALDKGMQQFHIAAQKTEEDYNFLPYIYSFMEDIIYNPTSRMIAMGIGISIVLFFIIIKSM
jgi:hypothetical protein